MQNNAETTQATHYVYVLIPVQNTDAEYSAKYKVANISAIFCTGISTYILATCIRHSCTVYTRAKCTVQVYIAYIKTSHVLSTCCMLLLTPLTSLFPYPYRLSEVYINFSSLFGSAGSDNEFQVPLPPDNVAVGLTYFVRE